MSGLGGWVHMLVLLLCIRRYIRRYCLYTYDNM